MLTHRLRTWFEVLPEPGIIVCDFDEDGALLANALLGREHRSLPDNVGETLVLDASIVSDPLFKQAQNRAYSQDWPPHHALADARALHARYRAWRAANG